MHVKRNTVTDAGQNPFKHIGNCISTVLSYVLGTLVDGWLHGQ